jgi:hypothetical protein
MASPQVEKRFFKVVADHPSLHALLHPPEAAQQAVCATGTCVSPVTHFSKSDGMTARQWQSAGLPPFRALLDTVVHGLWPREGGQVQAYKWEACFRYGDAFAGPF